MMMALIMMILTMMMIIIIMMMKNIMAIQMVLDGLHFSLMALQFSIYIFPQVLKIILAMTLIIVVYCTD